MSRYKIARFPQDRFRFRIYDNAQRLSWQKIKEQTGCYALINLAYFSLTTYKPEDTLMVDGKWLYRAPWPYNGLLVDKDGNLTVGPDSSATWGYANGEPAYRLGGINQPDTTHYAANGSTFVGVEADGTVVALLAPKDTPITSREGIAALNRCRDILRYDGSWSSQGSLGPGLDVDPSEERVVRSYLLIFEREKKEDEPVDGITKKYMTQNPCYLSQTKREKHNGMLHSTATSGAMFQAMFDLWNKPSAEAGVEFIIDDTGIYQTLPLGIKSAHAGTAAAGKVSANNTHVACEICEPWETIFLPINWRPLSQGGKYNRPYPVKRLQQELLALGFDPKGVDGSFGPGCTAAVKAYQASVGIPADGNVGPTTLKYLQKREGSYLRYNAALAEAYFRKVYGYAVELFAWLHGEIGLQASKILCHSEGFKQGIASNHADVLHWFPQHGKTMDTFRGDVAAAIAGTILPSNPLGDAVDKLVSKGVIVNGDYWKGGNYSAANVQALLIKMAAAI